MVQKQTSENKQEWSEVFGHLLLDAGCLVSFLLCNPFQLLVLPALKAKLAEESTLLVDKGERRVKFDYMACIKHEQAIVVNDSVQPMRNCAGNLVSPYNPGH